MLTTQVTQADLAEYAKTILSQVSSSQSEVATVITLQGDLGAGKTTFMKAFAAVLGVEDVVTSPTFVVMRIYDTSHQTYKKLVHIDAYRFTDPAEAIPLRLGELMADSENIICIEWPERLGDSLPANVHQLEFQVVDDETRAITYGKK